MRHSERGNAFLYILIAVILFAGLMFTISRSRQSESVGTLTEGRAQVAANAILSYATSAQNAISNLDIVGTDANTIDFTLPSDATFNNAPTIHKLFHPDGGSLTYKPLPIDASADDGAGLDAGFYIGRFNNIEWTPTAADDVVFVAFEISQDVCAAINLQLTGSDAIPNLVGNTMENLLIDDAVHGGSNSNFEIASCAACNEKPALCVSKIAADTKYGFYSIMIAQ
jgi:type II secretory pathway pseudopilin PulG